MSILLFLVAWAMLKFAHYKYTIGRPSGITYSNFGDYITAFLYQPWLHLLLMLMVVSALSIIFLTTITLVRRYTTMRVHNRYVTSLLLGVAILMAFQAIVYFPELSMLFILLVIYRFFSSKRKRKIKRITYY